MVKTLHLRPHSAGLLVTICAKAATRSMVQSVQHR